MYQCHSSSFGSILFPVGLLVLPSLSLGIDFRISEYKKTKNTVSVLATVVYRATVILIHGSVYLISKVFVHIDCHGITCSYKKIDKKGVKIDRDPFKIIH